MQNFLARTKLDVVLAIFFGLGSGTFVAAIISGFIYRAYEIGHVFEENTFPIWGYVLAFVGGLAAAFLGYKIVKYLLRWLGILVMGSGDLIEKTALEATVKIKEGKRKAAAIAREADIRVGVKKEIRTEEDAYERAAEELAEETQSKGLWAKAFSDANGDEKTQRALYIKYRAEQLIKNIVE
mgnify:CR=1 FL=1